MKRKPPGLDGELARTLIKHLSRANVAVFKATHGRVLGGFPSRRGWVPICVLRHTGRRTGRTRETPLICLEDGDRVVLVASQGGRPHHPAWYLNLSAHPEVEVLTRRGARPMLARTASAEERAALWPRLVARYPAYDDYQSWCPREIPVVVLDPR